MNSHRDTSPDGVLSALNPSQRQAVTAPDGPLLALAGAGSGKTRAIAHRIAFLIDERRVPPWTILALTFTNKAAAEMRSRVASLVGEAAPDLWVYTFHALSLRLLRRFGTDIGLPAEFSVFDEEDRRTILRRVIREMGLLERDYPVWRVASAVSARKNAALSRESDQKWRSRRDREILEEIAKGYQSELGKGKGLDFDDLLIRAVALMECSERARSFADKRFQHVLVDEYQDTNRIQYRLLRLLAPHGNLFVVGDEDQSIYNFRGADLRNILDFERDFPQARLVKLEQNYRSTGAILEAAGALIAHNQERKGKRLIPQLAGGGRPCLYGAADDHQEARYVANRIEELRRRSDACHVAVLVRTHAQTRLFEEEFISRQIPHILVGGQRFYERKEIKDALAYLRLLANPHDDQSFRRVVNVPPRGVGAASVALVQAAAADRNISLWDAASLLVDEGSLPSRAHAGLGALRDLRNSLAAKASRLPPAKLVAETIEETGLARAYQKESPVQSQTRQENLSQLEAAAYDYEQRESEPTLAGFLDQVSLFTDIDTVKSEAPCLLMTIHSAKGLEFDAVFLTGLEEGLFPHFRSSGSERSIEEERRLAYVGMTRAKENLFLTYARSRRSALEKENRRPSRFVSEIPSELVTCDPKSPVPPPGLEGAPAPASEQLRPGTVVLHPLFGEGTIVEAGPGGADQKITVQFRSAGRKKLIPRYAELQILGQSRRPPRRWR